MIHPVLVCHVVSSIKPAGQIAAGGRNGDVVRAKPEAPAARSSIAPKMLGESGLGTHIHSTLPPGAIRHVDSQSDKKA